MFLLNCDVRSKFPFGTMGAHSENLIATKATNQSVEALRAGPDRSGSSTGLLWGSTVTITRAHAGNQPMSGTVYTEGAGNGIRSALPLGCLDSVWHLLTQKVGHMNSLQKPSPRSQTVIVPRLSSTAAKRTVSRKALIATPTRCPAHRRRFRLVPPATLAA